jgi:c-di-GMP-binding flagellar brake protein YcgR
MADKTEKRGSRRCPVNVFVLGQFRHHSFSSTAKNISTSGIFLETDRVLAPRDKVSCSFVLQYQITVAGEVVRVAGKKADRYDYGVEFLNLDAKSKKQIEALVKAREDAERRRTGKPS